jgi:hypothetical protein
VHAVDAALIEIASQQSAAIDKMDLLIALAAPVSY